MRVKLPLTGLWLAVFLLALCVWFFASRAANRLHAEEIATESSGTDRNRRVSKLRKIEYAALGVMLTTMVAGVYVSM